MIGIVTYYHVSNYGANLQAFALQHILRQKGKDVILIKYESRFLTKRSMKNFFKKMHKEKNVLLKILILFNSIRTHFSFIQFREKYICIKKFKKNINRIIVGSDQVWNTEINGGDLFYFLNFFQGRKFSYAVSFGYKKMDKQDVEIFKPLIKEFYRIGVREKQGQNILKNQFNILSEVVLDPIFLLSTNEWKEQFNLHNIERNKYLFLYVIGNVSYDLQIYIKNIYNNLNLINYNNCFVLNPSIKNKSCLSPVEWLSYLLYSEIIVTNSYHGIIFSILFNKKFILHYNITQHYLSRQWGIFNLLGIRGKIVNLNIEERLFVPDLNYDLINKKIESMKNKSVDFLNKILEE